MIGYAAPAALSFQADQERGIAQLVEQRESEIKKENITNMVTKGTSETLIIAKNVETHTLCNLDYKDTVLNAKRKSIKESQMSNQQSGITSAATKINAINAAESSTIKIKIK